MRLPIGVVQARRRHVSVNLRRCQTPVAEQLLNGPDVGAGIEKSPRLADGPTGIARTFGFEFRSRGSPAGPELDADLGQHLSVGR